MEKISSIAPILDPTWLWHTHQNTSHFRFAHTYLKDQIQENNRSKFLKDQSNPEKIISGLMYEFFYANVYSLREIGVDTPKNTYNLPYILIFFKIFFMTIIPLSLYISFLHFLCSNLFISRTGSSNHLLIQNKSLFFYSDCFDTHNANLIISPQFQCFQFRITINF